METGRTRGAFKPLSILLINQDWLAAELRAMGHKVVWAGCCRGDCDVRFEEPFVRAEELVASLPEGFIPDRIVYYDDSAIPWLVGVDHLQIPSLFYSVDTHHHYPWHPHFARLFDEVLVAQRNYLANFKNSKETVRWFPLWALRGRVANAPRTIDASFRGNLDPVLHPQRAQFFERLNSFVEVDAASGPFDQVYAGSKIVVNESVKGDLNFRVFEAMACGAMLITPAVDNGLFALFDDGKDLVSYIPGDAEDAAKKIRYYLDNEAERIEIAERGRRRVNERHTSVVRAEELSDILQSMELRKKEYPYFASARAALAGACGLRIKESSFEHAFLREAAFFLMRSARLGEKLDDEFVSSVILCKCYLEEMGQDMIANELCKSVFSYCSTDEMLVLSRIEVALREGDGEVAKELAQGLSDQPAELMESIPRLMKEVQERVLTLSKFSG